MKRLFTTGCVVVGTDTDVGKTVVAALTVAALDGHYWKPVQCGTEDADTERVEELTGLPEDRFHSEAYRLAMPASPDQAAAAEGITIETYRLRQIPDRRGPIVVETAGGVMVPVNRDLLQIELLVEWNLPILLVARSGLGTLNHTLLTVEALRHRGLEPAVIALNGPAHRENERTLGEWIPGIPLLRVPAIEPLNRSSLVVATESWNASLEEYAD